MCAGRRGLALTLKLTESFASGNNPLHVAPPRNFQQASWTDAICVPAHVRAATGAQPGARPGVGEELLVLLTKGKLYQPSSSAPGYSLGGPTAGGPNMDLRLIYVES